MRCRKCNKELDEDWEFCPRCGMRKTLLRKAGNKDFDEIFDILEKNFRDLFGSNFLADFPFGKGFVVEISQDMDKPNVSIREFGEKLEEEPRKEHPVPKDSKVVEPKISVKEGGRAVEVLLPGVKSEKDISIKKFESSIELRAFADKKMYFTIIPKLRFRTLADKKLEDGLLTLRFE